jgi:hypothetical protein
MALQGTSAYQVLVLVQAFTCEEKVTTLLTKSFHSRFIKWSVSDDKKSLQEAQKALESVLADVKKVEGVKDVQRVVCGGCLDFKVMTSLPADKFGAWEEAKFAPEEDFLGKLKEIDGISTIETQTFTLMPM